MKSAWKTAVLLLACLAATPSSVNAQIGTPTQESPQDLARRYAVAILELDQRLPADSNQICTVAVEAARLWDAEAVNFTAPQYKAALPETLVAADSRVVARAELLDLVDSLGDMSARLTAARIWKQSSVATEQMAVANARAVAKQRNLAELQRAYNDYQTAVAARRESLWKLAALRSGRAKVVAVHSSPGGSSYQRDATPAEARAFAMNLYQQANAPFNILPPQKTRPVDIHSVAELVKLKGELPELARLQGLIDVELNNLAKLHSAELLTRLAGKDAADRKHALAAAGWWNDSAVRHAVFQAMEADDAEIRTAAFAGMRRMRIDPSLLMRFTKSPQEEVRAEVARIASEWIHEPGAALNVIRPLLSDPRGRVRSEAYSALSNLAPLAVPRKLDPANLTGQALISRNPSLIIDACQWLQSYGAGNGQQFNESTQKQLANLAHFPNPVVQAAAQAAQGGGAFR
jgi:hypothetical protein